MASQSALSLPKGSRESIVLLKNEDDFLPLSKEIGSIAVVGPNADDVLALRGNYEGTPSQVVTPLEGIRKKISPTTRLYAARGNELAASMDPLTVIPTACLRPAAADGYQTGLTGFYFECDNLRIDQPQVQVGSQVAIRCDVTNTGERTGDEVVQLYVRQPDATVTRPIKELKGFKRITLEPGGRKTVTFHLHTHQLGYYHEAKRYAVQPGTVEVMVGGSSKDLPLAGALEIKGQTTDASDHRVFFSRIGIE